VTIVALNSSRPISLLPDPLYLVCQYERLKLFRLDGVSLDRLTAALGPTLLANSELSNPRLRYSAEAKDDSGQVVTRGYS
jgi:hypothetical protein